MINIDTVNFFKCLKKMNGEKGKLHKRGGGENIYIITYCAFFKTVNGA